MKLLYVDVEWANSKNKSICQIGLMQEELDKDNNLYIDKNIYINPKDGFDSICVAIHNITEQKVKNCKTFPEVWEEISDYLYKSVIGGHKVASSDLDAIVKNINCYNLDVSSFHYIDTYDIAKHYVDPSGIADLKFRNAL